MNTGTFAIGATTGGGLALGRRASTIDDRRSRRVFAGVRYQLLHPSGRHAEYRGCVTAAESTALAALPGPVRLGGDAG